MELHRRALVVGLASLVTLSSLALADPARVTFDDHCFTIDGHDTLIYSAAFHYFRCPKPLWRDRFKKIKEAGFNTVESYIAWNWHERTPPKDVDDFSHVDMTDLDDFLKMASDEFGLNVIIRPGPYICAEWDGGGYPQWLTLFRPKDYVGMWYRGDDAEYLKWCRHWYAAGAKAVKPHLITNKPAGSHGVILWQLENEYDFGGKSAEVMHNQVAALGKMSREFGIDVPYFTCLTHNDALKNDPWTRDNVLETANLYPGFGLAAIPERVKYLDTYQPTKLKMITELQGGWFATLGNKLSDQQGHTAAQINQLTILMWELGFTSTNYYMGFGGSNPGDWAADRLMTTYDYNAPIRETGGTTDRYLAVKALGQFLAEQGDRMTRADALPIDLIEKDDRDVSVAVRRAKDGTRFVFLRTDDRDGPHEGTIRFAAKYAEQSKTIAPTIVRYSLPAFGAKICVLPPNVDDSTKGAWYPQPATTTARATKLPDPIEITSVKRKLDSLADTKFAGLYPAGSGVEDMGIFDRRTVVYQTSADLTSILNSGAKPILKLTLHDHDDASVFVMNDRVRQTRRDGDEAEYQLDHAIPVAPTSITVLYENGGRPNSGEGMERRNGLSRAEFVSSTDNVIPVDAWRSHSIDGITESDAIKTDFDDKSWTVVRADSDEGHQPVGTTFVYRASFDLDDKTSRARKLRIGRIDDAGTVYLNGEKIGTSTSWAEPFYADVSAKLKPGRNVIAVVVKNTDGPGGIARGVSLRPTTNNQIRSTNWLFAPGTAGMIGEWSKEKVDDSKWETIAINGRPIETDANTSLAWYRATFTLPANDPHAWVPWKIRLNIHGNAFLYFNGQPLGRYWNAGPQRDFYLPENMIKPGEQNVLTAAVRGLDNNSDQPEFRSATVMPYADQAEAR